MQLNTIEKKLILKNRLTFLFVLLFVYVVLFEFVLPVNKILPKPSLLVESIPALFSDYNFISEMAITTSIVYLSLAAGFFIVWLFSYQLSKMVLKNIGLFNNLKLFRNFPAFFFAVLFAFWFDDSILAELMFAIIIASFFIAVDFIKAASSVPEEFINAGKSLLHNDKQIHKNVIWKYSLPLLFKNLTRLHYYLWVLLLIYEFIGAVNGFGGIYNLALEYKDFSVIILLGIAIALLIWLGNSIINYLQKKLVFWKVD